MSSCSEFLDSIQSEEHVVQLYGSDDRLLTSNVGRFLSEGLKRGDGVLVIASAEHRTSLTRHLRQDPAYSRAVLEGRLVFLDAETTLGRIMVHGAPDPELFQEVVGKAVAEVGGQAGHSGVRAYGEMVGLLWRAGARDAAARLEELWNRLLRDSQVSLFCAYPIDVFGPDFQPENVEPLLCNHTHLVPVDSDLEQALHRAMEEVLGPRLDGLTDLIRANDRPAWGQVPAGEALILWLRNSLPESADRILRLAREKYQAVQRAGS